MIPRDNKWDSVGEFLKVMLVWIIFLAAILGAFAVGNHLHHNNTPVGKVCWEDQPCWDCHTMGNRICGKGHG